MIATTAAALVFGVAACSTTEKAATKDGGLTIVATTGYLGDAAHQIAPDNWKHVVTASAKKVPVIFQDNLANPEAIKHLKEAVKAKGWDVEISDKELYADTLGEAATVAIVIGVKAVGLILMIAFANMPAAAARQWMKRLSSMVALSATIGGVTGAVGSYLSVNMGKVPTGPIVVLLLFLIFLISLAFAPERSVLRRAVMRRAKARELEAIARGEIPFEEARALQNQSDFSRGRQPAPLGRKEPAPTHPGGAN